MYKDMQKNGSNKSARPAYDQTIEILLDTYKNIYSSSLLLRFDKNIFL